MTDTVKKFEDRAAYLENRIAVLSGEVERHSSTDAGANRAQIDRMLSQIERFQSSLARVRDRLSAAKIRAAKREAAAKKREATAAALARTAEAADAKAAEVMRKFRADRAAEPRRIEQRKKALRKRVTKDLSQPPRPFLGYSMAPTVQQPKSEDLAPPAIDPPRAGILPGDFRLLDDDGDEWRPAYRPPSIWTADHVGRRLIEALQVLRRTPASIWPKGFKVAWPEYRHEGVELAYQAGAGTLGMGRNRARVSATADEVARMNEAITWPMEVFARDEHAARTVTEWVDDVVWRGDGYFAGGGPLDLLRRIADWLNERKVAVS